MKKTKILLLSAVGLLGLATAASAQTIYTWNVASGNWNAAGSWTPGGGPPVAGDTANITSASAVVNLNTTPLPALTVNQSNGAASRTTGFTLSGTIYNLSGGTLTVSGAGNDIILNTAAQLNVSGSGALSIADQVSVGAGSSVTISSGSVSATGFSLTNTGYTVNISGGTTSLSGTFAMSQNGTVSVSGGTVTAAATTLASATSGATLSISAGTFNGGALTLNRATVATASEIQLSGSGKLSISSITFGAAGSFAPSWDFSNSWSGFLSLTGATTLNDYWNALTSLGAFGNVQLNNSVIDQSTFNSTFSLNGSNALVIPEPTTWFLLAGSLTALVVFRRRRVG